MTEHALREQVPNEAALAAAIKTVILDQTASDRIARAVGMYLGWTMFFGPGYDDSDLVLVSQAQWRAAVAAQAQS